MRANNLLKVGIMVYALNKLSENVRFKNGSDFTFLQDVGKTNRNYLRSSRR